MKYQAALFDMDGVILDSEPLHAAAFQATLELYGHTLTDEQYKEHFAGRTDKAGFESYLQFVNESIDVPVIMDQKAQKYLALAADQLIAYPGIVQVIRELSEQMPLALVTGSLRAETEVALSTLGIVDCFQAIVTAEDVIHGKPDPEGYLKAAQSLGVAIENCVVIEDSPNGVRAAVNAGAECIAVTHTHTPDELQEATKIVASLQLIDFK